MKTPTPLSLSSITPRLRVNNIRVANRYIYLHHHLHRYSHCPSKAFRASSNPACTLTRPSSELAQPHGFSSQLIKGDTKFCAASQLSQIRNIHYSTRHASQRDSRYSSRTQPHLKSQISPLLYAIPLVVFGALAFYGFIPSTPGVSSATQDIVDEFLSEDFEIEEMEQLPGRPGNLTPEEDEKLRKFWEMFLRVCNVIGEEVITESETTSETASRVGTATSEKPKKKRMSLFKKKKDKDGEKTSKSQVIETIKENDPEDKWGENKTYLETLATHSPEQIRATIWTMVKHDHPDALLLRFLRARKWDLHRALVMMMSTMNWRCSESRVDEEIMANGEEYAATTEKSSDPKTKKLAEDFLAQLRMGKSYCYGTDKAGRPICFVRARLHRAGEQSEEGLERFTVYLIETTRFMLNPPIDTACVVFDLTGFSLQNMDYTPVKFMIKCFEANYPESLGVVLVHKAPWVFQGIWKIVRGWLDPVVASKVHFTNNVKDMEEFIAKERIPDDLEGTSGYTYEYKEPIIGENAKMKDIETKEKLLQERETLYEEYESKTIEWISELDPLKRGSIHSERDAIAKKLREQYWRLDPYFRSRSLYDRTGVIKPGGHLDYYPSQAPPAAANGTAAAIAAGETAADDVD